MKTKSMMEPATAAAPESRDLEESLSLWLVDESAGSRGLLATPQQFGPQVECSRGFASAASLLAALEQEYPPDAILLDLQMPVMNGIEVIQGVKNLAPFASVLLLTDFDDPRFKYRARLAGAADILLKSSSPGQIIAALQKALRPH